MSLGLLRRNNKNGRLKSRARRQQVKFDLSDYKLKLFQICSRWPPEEKTGRESLLNRPSSPPDDAVKALN